jgi:tetratricopeptide (TPR) repeat protein
MGSMRSQINILLNSKSEADRRECARLLQLHLEKSPNDIEAWYDLACCFDFLGDESVALKKYRVVYEEGPLKLPAEKQIGFYVGFGSTLRNCLKYSDSEIVLREGISKFPGANALQTFLAFTLYSQGRFREASELLFQICSAAPQDGYERAVKRYAEQLDSRLK